MRKATPVIALCIAGLFAVGLSVGGPLLGVLYVLAALTGGGVLVWRGYLSESLILRALGIFIASAGLIYGCTLLA